MCLCARVCVCVCVIEDLCVVWSYLCVREKEEEREREKERERQRGSKRVLERVCERESVCVSVGRGKRGAPL